MKKRLVTLLLLPAFLAMSCEKNSQNDLPSGAPPVTPSGDIVDYVTNFFDGYSNSTSHNRLKSISDEKHGFMLQFRAYQKVNETVTFDLGAKLCRNDNIVWAESTLSVATPAPEGVDLPYTVKGAVKYVNEPESFEVYYADNTEDYTYYGTAYNDELGLDISDLESYFDLSDGLLMYLIAREDGKIASYAGGHKSLYFSMTDVTLTGASAQYTHLEIAFDFETHLIMYYNYWYVDTTVNKVYMTVFEVGAFSYEPTPPTLVK